MKSFVMNLVGRTPVLLLFTAAFVTLVAMSWLKAVPPVSAQSQLSPTVAIDSTSDIPVTITELRVVQNGVQPAHLEYKVKNESSERLLSVEITWHFSFSKAKGSVIRTRLDYFFDDPSRMNPGASDRNKTGLPFLK